MTDYYVFQNRAGLTATLRVEFLLSTKDHGIARDVIERTFQKREFLDGAFGIERDTQVQVSYIPNLSKGALSR